MKHMRKIRLWLTALILLCGLTALSWAGAAGGGEALPKVTVSSWAEFARAIADNPGGGRITTYALEPSGQYMFNFYEVKDGADE